MSRAGSRHLTYFYLDEVAAALRVHPNYVRILCRKHPDLFPERYYRRRGSHPRTHRVWLARDVALLHGLLCRSRPT